MTLPTQVEIGLRDLLTTLNPLVTAYAERTLDVSVKRDGSIVTDADKTVENRLKDGLHQLLPNAYFLGEESAPKTESQARTLFDFDYVWCVDPIDGTNNFAQRIPFFATSVGLLARTGEGLSPVAGAVLLPGLDELCYTFNDEAYTQRLSTGQRERVDREGLQENKRLVMLSTRFFNNFTFDNKRFGGAQRMLGSTVNSLTYVALGRAAVAMTTGCPWDVAAGHAIAKTQGLEFRDYETGAVIEGYKIADFSLDEEKRFWHLRRPQVLSDEETYHSFKESVKRL